MRQAASRPLPRTLGLLAAPEYLLSMHSRSLARSDQGSAYFVDVSPGRLARRCALAKTSWLRCIGGARGTCLVSFQRTSVSVGIEVSGEHRTARVVVGALRWCAEPKQPGRRGISCVAAYAATGMALRRQKTVWSVRQYSGTHELCASAAWPNTSVKGTSCGKPQAAPYLER